MGKNRPKNIDEAIQYFRFLGGTAEQAHEWHDYNISIGWVVGSTRAPLKDWQASARNWARRAKKWGAAAPQAQQVYTRPTEPARTMDVRQGVQMLKDAWKCNR